MMKFRGEEPAIGINAKGQRREGRKDQNWNTDGTDRADGDGFAETGERGIRTGFEICANPRYPFHPRSFLSIVLRFDWHLGQ
jgi:hypothetical protein